MKIFTTIPSRSTIKNIKYPFLYYTAKHALYAAMCIYLISGSTYSQCNLYWRTNTDLKLDNKTSCILPLHCYKCKRKAMLNLQNHLFFSPCLSSIINLSFLTLPVQLTSRICFIFVFSSEAHYSVLIFL